MNTNLNLFYNPAPKKLIDMKNIIFIVCFLPLFCYSQNLYFTINPAGNKRFEFLNFSDITNTIWDFGDGSISEEFSPFHEFDSAKTYKVCLICDTLKFCRNLEIKDPQFQPIRVYPVPVRTIVTVDLMAIESDIDFVEIYCPEGLRIYLSNNNYKLFSIDLSDEESGIFTVLVWTKDNPKKNFVTTFQK